MTNPLKNPWGDGRNVQVLEPECAFRSCLRVGENKGPFTQGRGYTSYYKNPELVCMARHLHGCPHPIPTPEIELMRCCPAPSFAPIRKVRPQTQICKLCGTRSPISIVDKIKALPPLPHIKCRHEKAVQRSPLGEDTKGWLYCSSCNLWFKGHLKPFEIGIPFREVLDSVLKLTKYIRTS